ncbi:MAG: hypothetical protein EB059_10685 [Alphaproteobacteria bacterium]|nr:hypothetical protein [Alphaproteobacteria bacterium]
MGYFEFCSKHGQYKGDYCGDCIDELYEDNERLKEEIKQQKEFEAADRADVKALTTGFEFLQKENARLREALTRIEAGQLCRAHFCDCGSSLEEIARAALEEKMDKELKQAIETFKELMQKVDTSTWSFSANAPFYIDIQKPRASLSKHDDKCPTYWHYDDGRFVAAAIYLAPALIKYLEKQNKKV